MLEIAGVLLFGIFAQWMAWKVNQPAILPLIIIGLLVGPVWSLFSEGGNKLINPDDIFVGDMLFHFISLSVAVILFEGGLTLKLKEVKHLATTVRNLIVFGLFITFIGGGLAAHYILDMEYRIAFLFGALIIVTGPTVIIPILRNVRPNKNINTVLKWEGILIDPVGALVAVLVFDFIISSSAGEPFTFLAIFTFAKSVLTGLLVGAGMAALLYFIIKKHQIPEYLYNVVALALVILAYTLSDMIESESGLVAVTLMGMILANVKIPELRGILNFKESLTLLLVSVAFIILPAKINIAQIELLGWRSIFILAIVIFVLRPLTIFASSIGSGLSFKERIFISWIGPRGIVAAAVASIFSYHLAGREGISVVEEQQAQLLIPLTFLIILGTVILQGSTAKVFAEWLGVTQKDGAGFVLLGAHEAARSVAVYLQKNNIPVLLVDTSPENVKEAKAMGLNSIEENILSEDISDDLEFTDTGKFLALTSNNEINIFACKKFSRLIGKGATYRLITRNEMKFSTLDRPGNILFTPKADVIRLIEAARDYPEVQEVQPESKEHLEEILKAMEGRAIPLFLISIDKSVQVITADGKVDFMQGDRLAYLGRFDTGKSTENG